MTDSGKVFITNSLQPLLSLKEIKKQPQLHENIRSLLYLISQPQADKGNSKNNSLDPNTLLINVLQSLIQQNQNAHLIVVALDLMSKLWQYDQSLYQHSESIIDLIYTYCQNGELDEKVVLQLFQILPVLVSDSKTRLVHGNALLKCLRIGYNIFLISKKSMIQNLAQSTISQMIHHIFGFDLKPEEVLDYPAYLDKQKKLNTTSTTTTNTKEKEEKEEMNGHATAEEVCANVINEIVHLAITKTEQQETIEEKQIEINIKDAIMVFKTLCQLSLQPIDESSKKEKDILLIKSKILSLEILNLIVSQYFSVLATDISISLSRETKSTISQISHASGSHSGSHTNSNSGSSSNGESDKDSLHTNEEISMSQILLKYLYPSLSLNLQSSVPEILDRACSILVCMIMGMRHVWKKQIYQLLNMTVFPVLEMNGMTGRGQNLVLMRLAVLMNSFFIPLFGQPATSTAATTTTGTTVTASSPTTTTTTPTADSANTTILKEIQGLGHGYTGPQILLDFYLNYDLDLNTSTYQQPLSSPDPTSNSGRNNEENVVERLLGLLSKLIGIRDEKMNGILNGIDASSVGVISMNKDNLYSTSSSTSTSQTTQTTQTSSNSNSSKDSLEICKFNSLNTNHPKIYIHFHNQQYKPLPLPSIQLQKDTLPPSILPMSSHFNLGWHLLNPHLPSQYLLVALPDNLSSSISGTGGIDRMRVSLKGRVLEVLCWILKDMCCWSRGIGKVEGRAVLPDSPTTTSTTTNSKDTTTTQTTQTKEDPVVIIDDLSKYEHAHQTKKAIKEGIRLFNWKIKRGLDYLLHHQIISNTPESIASFLLHTNGLDKVMIGEYLGDGDLFHISVMHSFVGMLSFKGLRFTDALRGFLKCFRLPGEAQKIDRFMLKFAERYCLENQGIFESADVAYVLAYSVIMLNTDLHNPQVKKRMKKEEFVRNNRGIAGGKDLDRVYLEEIYDEILKNEIKMRDDSNSSTAVDTVTNEDSTTTTTNSNSTTYHIAKYKQHVQSIMESCWMSLLAGLSHSLQSKHTDSLSYYYTLHAFQSCIYLSSLPSTNDPLQTARDAFIKTLSKHSESEGVGYASVAMLECIVWSADGLGHSWEEVFRWMSSLNLWLKKSEKQDGLNQLLLVMMDRIFTQSSHYSGQCIELFVMYLCRVSQLEMQQGSGMFLLNKLVEVCYYNMSRIRMEWKSLWSHVGMYFLHIGLCEEREVCLFGMDALRQMSMKFMEKEELSNFKFQYDFLLPFGEIFREQKSVEVKDFILRSVRQLVSSKGGLLKSGWKSVMRVWQYASSSDGEGLIQDAFDMMKEQSSSSRVKEWMDVHQCFPEYVKCLVGFSRQRLSPKISLQSCELLYSCVDILVSTTATTATTKDTTSTTNTTSTNNEGEIEKQWFIIHFGFYEMILGCDLECRTKALTYLFQTLKQYSSQYTSTYWSLLTKGILLPIFDDLKSTGERTEEEWIWIHTTLMNALRQLIQLLGLEFGRLKGCLFGSVLGLLKVCFEGCQEEEHLVAKMGSASFELLLSEACFLFDSGDWDLVVGCMEEIFEVTTAGVLFDEGFVECVLFQAGLSTSEPKQKRHLKEDFKKIKSLSILHVILLQTLTQIISKPQFHSSIHSIHLKRLLKCVEESLEFARRFHKWQELRIGLFKSGFMKSLPNVSKQETTAAKLLMDIYGRLFLEGVLLTAGVSKDSSTTAGDTTSKADSKTPYFDYKADRSSITEEMKQKYIWISLLVLQHLNEKQCHLSSWTPVLHSFFHTLNQLEDVQFMSCCKLVYWDVIRLMKGYVLGVDLKEGVCLFLEKVGRGYILVGDNKE